MSALTDLTRALRRRRLDRGAAPVEVDPFLTLAIQVRLNRVAAEIHHLEHDQGRWARAHHLVAATRAYDDLLVEAARLSGLQVPDTDPPVRRLLLETQLRVDGWSW